MDMHRLLISVLTNVKGRHPLANEGLSVSSAFLNGEKFLVAFGGYNGKYKNEVYVMRPKPADSDHPKIFQSPAAAAAAAAASVTAAYAVTKSEINVIKEEKKALELTIKEELHSVQNQLPSERSGCDDLETQILELQKKLSSMQSIEQQVQELRSHNSAIEQDMELALTAQTQSAGGVWRWIAG